MRREISALDYKEELMNSEIGYWLKQVDQVDEQTLINMLRKVMSHPEYRRNRYSALVIDIMQRNGDFSAKQRACLEIHYAIESIKLFPDQGEGDDEEIKVVADYEEFEDFDDCIF